MLYLLAFVVFAARRNIYLDSQHPQGWEKIQNLEQRAKYDRIEVADAPLLAPRFTSQLRVSPLGKDHAPLCGARYLM